MRNDGPIQAEGPGLDDEGRPSRWWARLLFQPRLLIEGEYRLGLVVIGLAVFLACYIWASVLPQMIANLGIGIVNTVSWLGTMFSGGGGTQEAVAPAVAPVTTVLPSPSPSPFASPFPFSSPSPSPSPLPR